MKHAALPVFEFYPAAHIDGSLPDGGFVPDTPIWATEIGPFLKPSSQREATSQRLDIPLGDKLAFIIENVVDADEADTIVALTEKMGYRPEAPGISTPPGMRQNKTVHWVSDETLLGTIMAENAPRCCMVERASPVQ